MAFNFANARTRRSVLSVLSRLGAVSALVDGAFAASDFWNRKEVSAWSEAEIAQLLSRSPWAKEVNAEFEMDSDFTTNGSAGPSIGRGGVIGPPGTGSGAPAQIELGRDANGGPRGARRREPVTVRWESAKPILDALGKPLDPEFAERYVLSVSGLPLGVMERPRRGVNTDVLRTDPEDNTPQARQRRMIEQLQAAATLEAKGREPAQPGLVKAAPRMPGTYLFGFSKELIVVSARDKEVQFTLRTALMSVRAKFETKDMTYRGQFAV